MRPKHYGKPPCLVPWLSEIAAFEWALTLAFDAADNDVATEQDMVKIQPEAWPHIRFIPHASVQRLDLRWNVVPIWKAAKNDNPLPAPEASEYPQSWVIWRQELKNYYRSLEVDEGWALDGLLKGETFSAICGGLCEWVDEQHTAVHAAGLDESMTHISTGGGASLEFLEGKAFDTIGPGSANRSERFG